MFSPLWFRTKGTSAVGDRDTGTRYLTPQPRLFAGRLRGWRRSRAASGELAPKNSLEVPDERLIAERAAGGLGSPERGGGGRRLGVGQKGRDVADPVQQRPCHDQPVILARQGDRYRVPVSSYLRQSAAPTGPPVVREACKARVATWSSAPANIPAKSAIRASRGAALGDMVRKAGDDDAGKTGHGAAPGSVRLGGRRATISYSVTVTPDFLGQCAGTAFPL